MSSPAAHPTRHRAALVATLALTLGAAACTVSERPSGDGARTTETASAGGEVARAGWTPAAVASFTNLPAADVKRAVAARIAAGKPEELSVDQWRRVTRLYKQYGQQPLWMDEQGIDDRRATALLKALVSADQDALDLTAYPLPALAEAVAALKEGARPTAEQVARADVLMSSAYVALAHDLLTGQTDPKTTTTDWFINANVERLDSAIVAGLGDPDVTRGIDRMRPATDDYRALRQQLVRYRELAAKGDWPKVPAGRSLKPGEGDSPARLAALRDRLAAEGLTGAATGSSGDSVQAAATDSSRGQAAAGVDTGVAAGRGNAAAAGSAKTAARRAVRPGQVVYDQALAAGVAAFQARHGITVDSALGPETVNALNVPVSFRLGQIAANLERHRWLPHTLGARYVVANVPAFRLEAFEGEKKVLEMKVVVGKDYEDRKTPVFADTMRTVVFRPYWNITDDIAEKETWPKIRADAGYMERENLETYTEGGKTRLRQKPGEENSLGLVKFLFPNAYNIYFHDTPEKQLFAKDVRDFSHGCIRLEKPEALAQWVLGWPADSVKRSMEQGKDNQEVKLATPLPVYIAYFTTYLKDGQLYFGNDLYGRDREVVAAMQARAGQSPEVVQAVETLRKLVAS
jgi:murein L,D-transpeptidase YcbB/YkuD